MKIELQKTITVGSKSITRKIIMELPDNTVFDIDLLCAAVQKTLDQGDWFPVREDTRFH